LAIRLDGSPAHTESLGVAPHFAIGARRAVSDRSDLGVRAEFDDIDGDLLLSVRALDYRYRFHNPLAVSVFVGASRLDLATPAYGYYYGAGVQWRNLLPNTDVGLDLRYGDKIARDKLLPSDPPSTKRPDSFYDLTARTASLAESARCGRSPAAGASFRSTDAIHSSRPRDWCARAVSYRTRCASSDSGSDRSARTVVRATRSRGVWPPQ
jgi:hypothetical protein